MLLLPQERVYRGVCHQKAKQQRAQPTHTVAEADVSQQPEYHMYTIAEQLISVEMLLNDTPVTMEIDTGATLSIMSKQPGQQRSVPHHYSHPAQNSERTLARASRSWERLMYM